MAAPSREAICQTPHGIDFWVAWDGYDEHWTDSGVQVTAVVRVAWADRIAFVAEMCGYTVWDGASVFLNRHVPYGWPTDPYLVCSDLKFVSRGLGAADGSVGGAFPEPGVAIADPDADGWPLAGYVQYLATFVRRMYTIRPDADGFDTGALKEVERYVTTSWQEVAREQQIGALQLVNALDPTQLVGAKGFLPDHTYTLRCTWHQVPVDAVPWLAVALSTNAVNSTDMYLPFGDTGSTQWLVAGSLLFKGLPDDTKPYAGADGGLYVDLHYLFDWRPTVPPPAPGKAPDPTLNYYGWNGYRRPDGTWIPLAMKSGSTYTPPYRAADHTKLFVPGYAG